MATLSITNNLTGTMADGSVQTAKQGVAGNDFDEAYDLTTNGIYLSSSGSLPTGGSVTVYDDDTHIPANPVYSWFWTDKVGYIQLVGATSNIIIPLYAYVPFVWYGNTLLAAGNTTDIASSEPTLEDIDHIKIGNWSGSTMVYAAKFFY